LQNLQKSNILEIKFKRRHLKPGAPLTRRMLCTGDLSVLNSPQGRVALNFRPAYSQPLFNPTIKNLLVTWDIFMQNYRMVNMDACELITLVPNAGFWKFFNERLALMSTAQKMQFMNS
tara:strand:+ start:7676 stop:8029 length:354 start_codon:yes stop_codon:yes gene_type:complete